MSSRKRFAILFAATALLSAAVGAAAAWPEAIAVPLLLLLALFLHLDRRVLRPAERLGEELRTLLQSDRAETPVAVPVGHRLGPLPEAVADLAGALRQARQDVRQVADAAHAQAREHKGWLEVILLDLSDGVLVCNLRHQILLCNQAAVRLLGAPESVAPGRSLFSLVTRHPVLHTLERLELHLSQGAGVELSAPFVCATPDARVMLHGRMALMLGPGPEREVTGYVVTLTDISQDIASLARTESVRRALTWGLRGPVASLRAAAEMLTAFPHMTAEERGAFHRVVEHESTRISEQIEALAAEHGGVALTRWPMADVYSADLFACVAHRLAAEHGLRLTMIGIPLWLHGDSHSLVVMLADLVLRVHRFHGLDAFDIEAVTGDRRVYADITWTGPLLPSRALESWRDDVMEGLAGDQTLRDILDRHGSEPWSQVRPHGQAVLRIPLLAPLRTTLPPPPLPPPLPPRPEVTDLALLAAHAHPGALAGRPLRDLGFVVFDTETTGLHPRDGDTILQIAGVRVVNGRLLTGERFERLVDPQRPIPPESIRFHGITDEMVAGKPPLRVVLPQFRNFVGDAVLVAHNAAFDLGFLAGREVAFGNVVLDTMLLSLLADPGEADHSLDAVTRRLGITAPDRHTALGDALAAAAALVRLIDRLESKGLQTLDDVLKASLAAAEKRRETVV